jgi:hypothetical protein
LVQPGVYAATVNGQDFWGVITPTVWGPRWYGLHYAALNPDIYSGDLAGAGTASASVSALRYFQNTAATVLSGTASVREHVQRLGRILRRQEGKTAILYEVITRGTAEEHQSGRRREHDAYR